MRKSVRTLIVFAVVGPAALTGATHAAADPVIVISGSMLYQRSDTFGFTFRLSNGARISADTITEGWMPSHACSPCEPGSTLTPSVTEAFAASDPVQELFGSVEWEGTIFKLTDLSFSIAAGPVVIPNPPIEGTGMISLSDWAQFTLQGLATGMTADGLTTTLNLIGQGRVNVGIDSASNWFDTQYIFEDPAAVPEPATLLLFGSGALMAVRMRRKGVTS
jgi:hypothetical protein